VIATMIELLKELWLFMKFRKKYWLLPVIIVLLLVGFLLVAGSGAASPFIYTLF
jgi:hypothetical protein